MDGRFNTIAGWLLFGGILVLGFSYIAKLMFESEAPEQKGYAIAGVESSEGGSAGPDIGTLMASADAAAGEGVFGKCVACHTINAGGAAGIGPNLHGIMGKPIAGGSFAYSDALKAVGGNWTWEQMDAWLASPRKFANGTKMTFAGLSSPEDRANIMLYMNEQGSNIPLPTPAAAEEAPAEGDEAAEGEEAAAEGEAEAAADDAAVAEETAEADEAAAAE